MLDDLKKDAVARMTKCVQTFQADLRKLRTGRAHPSLVEHLKVDYYGSEVPLSQVANITIEDARTIAITPWEKTMVQVIDPPNVPRVMDYQRLLSDNSWTGRLLTPRDRRAWWSGRIAWFAAGVFLVSAIVGLVRHHRSRSKTGSPGLSVFVVHPHP